AQLLIGSATIWLPRQLSEKAISRDRLVGSLDAAETYAKRVDRWIKPRLTFLFNPPFIQIVAALGMAVSLSMFPLALVPFGALPAGLSLLFIGLALAVRDGVLMAVGVALGLGGMALAGWLFLF
ncbi:MAG: exopolysaccharide biosynthesis protein, partial [Pseudomonadota bacterium]